MPTDFPDYAQASNPPFPITSISNANGAVTDQVVALPAGCRCISMGFPQPLGTPSFSIVGGVTGEPYTEALQAGIFMNYPLQWLLIDPADTSIKVSLGATPVTTLYIGGSFSPVAVALNINEDVLAQIVNSTGLNLGSFNTLIPGMQDSSWALAVGLPQPLPWMAPAHTHDTANGSVAAGSTIVAVPAAPGTEDTFLFDCNLACGTMTETVSLVGHVSGKVLATFFVGVTNQPLWHHDYRGAPLATLTGTRGEQLDWKNNGASGQFVAAQIDYSNG